MISTTTKKFLDTCRQNNEAAGFGPNVFAYIYARISDEDRNDDYSIPRQLAAARKYCEDNSITVLGDFFEERSSMNFERRKEFVKMLDLILSGNPEAAPDADCVVCLNYSRFGRDMEECSRLFKQFSAAGKAILSCAEDFGLDANGRFMRNLTFAFNENQVVQIADDTFNCMIRAANEGKPTGQVPFGFKIIKAGYGKKEKRIVVDKRDGPAVRYIFESVDQGLSYDTIREHLKSQGVKTRAGNDTFSNSAINYILSNVAYKGIKSYCSPKSLKKCGRVTLLTSSQIFAEKLPKIVESELFDRVQKILSQRRNGSREHTGLDGKYILKAKIRCVCGRACQGLSKKNRLGKATDYYHCPDHEKGAVNYCGVKDVNRKNIEYAVFSLTSSVINSPDIQTQVMLKLQGKAAELERAALKAQEAVNEENEKHLNLVKQLAKGWGVETEAMIEGQIRQVVAEKERLKAVSNSLNERLMMIEKMRLEGIPAQKTADYLNAERRKVIERLIESITVGNNEVRIIVNLKENGKK